MGKQYNQFTNNKSQYNPFKTSYSFLRIIPLIPFIFQKNLPK